VLPEMWKERQSKREGERVAASKDVEEERAHMGHMGLEYMGQDICLTPPFKLKAEMEDLKR